MAVKELLQRFSKGAQQLNLQTQRIQPTPPTVYEQQYLLGFRGLLVIEAFLWVFLQTFVPTAVASSHNHDGPFYQHVLRKVLSPLFWNEYYLYGALIFLSARSVAIPFIRNPEKGRVARSVMTRGIALWFPVAFSLAIITVSLHVMGREFILDFIAQTRNTTINVPYPLPNTLAFFNAVYDVFWTTHNFAIQAASTAFPSQTLWMITAVYMQSYTVYLTMIIIPFTRRKWRVQAAVPFIITAWWVQSWAWYTITGLLFADMVMNMDFKAAAQRGIPLPLKRKDGSPRRIPVWLPAGVCMLGGYLMQYLWVAWRPDLFDAEYLIHSGLYYTGGLNYDYADHHTPARDDIYLILVGFFLFLESYDWIQRLFDNPFFVFLGKRSLSYFLTQSIMIYIVGIKTFQSLTTHDGVMTSGATFVTLLTSLAVVIPTAEAFYRLIERPSKMGAHAFYDFITS